MLTKQPIPQDTPPAPARRMMLNIPDDDLRRIQADLLQRAKARDSVRMDLAVVANPDQPPTAE